MPYIQAFDLEVDGSLHILGIMGAAQQISGYDDLELKGKHMEALLGNGVEKLKTQLLELRKHPPAEAKFSIYSIAHKDGSRKQCYIYPGYDPADENEKYKLHIVPEISNWELPFISTDTRNLFFEEFSNMPIGTFEWHIDTDQVFWSDGIHRIYEVKEKGQLLNLDSIQQYTHPDDRRLAGAAVQRALDGSRSYDIEMKVVTARNNAKIVHAVGKPILDAQGRVVKLIGCIRDITAQKHTEGELKTSVTDLHRSNRELEEFAYAASHDLQEPLRKISTFSDRLQQQYKNALSDDGAMYLDRIMAASGNMRMLIDNLLDFSRLSQSVEVFAPVNIKFIVTQVMTDLELIIEETGATIQCHELPVLDASVVQMKQLFTNLLNNAIKFRQAGIPPVIDVSGHRMTEEEKVASHVSLKKEYFEITVADNGIGFEEEYAGKIFQIFQRLHGKAEYPGSGIGLAICKKIVEKHHGIIYAEGQVNIGATFVMILPEKQVSTQRQ